MLTFGVLTKARCVVMPNVSMRAWMRNVSRGIKIDMCINNWRGIFEPGKEWYLGQFD